MTRATSLQPTATPQKEHEKSQHKIKKRSTTKEGIKTVQRETKVETSTALRNTLSFPPTRS
jgi:hypothetical protein